MANILQIEKRLKTSRNSVILFQTGLKPNHTHALIIKKQHESMFILHQITFGLFILHPHSPLPGQTCVHTNQIWLTGRLLQDYNPQPHKIKDKQKYTKTDLQTAWINSSQHVSSTEHYQGMGPYTLHTFYCTTFINPTCAIIN